MKKTIPTMLSIMVLTGMLTLAFNKQETQSSDPPATEWSRTYGGSEPDWGSSMVQTSDEGYAIAGVTWSFGSGGEDFWLVKTDSNGNMQWNKTYGGTNDDWAHSVIQTNDGGYALAGKTKSSGAGSADFWLVKTDSNGNIQWDKTYGGVYKDFGLSVVQTSDGGYAIGGITGSFGAGAYDFWLVRTDSVGNIRWSQTYGGADYDECFYMIQTNDGGYALVGYTRSFGAGNEDFWLVKTDSNGNMQWNRTYGGGNKEYAYSVVQTGDGGYAIAGHTSSLGAGDYDFWLVKTDSNGNMQWNRTYGGANLDSVHSLIQTSDRGYVITGATWSFGAGSADFWLVKTDSNGNMQWNRTYGGIDYDGGYSVVQTGDGGYAIAGCTDSYGAGDRDFWLIKLALVEILPQIELSIKLSGELDYGSQENVKVKVVALVADVNTKEPVSDANVTIIILDPEKNTWFSGNMAEELEGIYLWESNETVKEISRHHGKGVYTVQGKASVGDGPTAYDILTFHIDPPPPPPPPSPLPTIIGISLGAIAMIALATVFIKKKRSPQEKAEPRQILNSSLFSRKPIFVLVK